MTMNRFTPVAAALALSFTAASASAQVNLTLKLMEYDVTQPTREEYRDSELGDRPINQAIEQAWAGVASGRVNDAIKEFLKKPDRFGSGMTARDIDVRLGAPGAMQLVSTGQTKGTATIKVSGNEIDLTTTHPLSRGKSMDPRVRIKFDLTLTIDLFIEPDRPRLRAIDAVAQPGNVNLFALNHSAAIGGAIDKLLSDFGGTPSLTDKVRGAMQQSRLGFANTFNSEMDKKAPSLVLPGHIYNGGRIENGRVLIAQYKVKPTTPDRVAIVASWPKSLGELMNDCGPVAIGANWQAGPKPFAGVKEPKRQAGKVTNVNPRTMRRDEYICSTVVEVAKGAPLQVTWAQPVPVNVGSPNPMAMRQVLAAKPAGWNNPIVPNAIEYVLALNKESRPGIGVQSDAITAAKRNPLDPIAQERRVDQVSQPQVSTAVPAVTANPVAQATPPAAANPVTQVTSPQAGAAPSPATSFATTRTQQGATTSATTRLQTPQRTYTPDSALSR
jgi:hypothetical protein